MKDSKVEGTLEGLEGGNGRYVKVVAINMYFSGKWNLHSKKFKFYLKIQWINSFLKIVFSEFLVMVILRTKCPLITLLSDRAQLGD